MEKKYFSDNWIIWVNLDFLVLQKVGQLDFQDT